LLMFLFYLLHVHLELIHIKKERMGMYITQIIEVF